MYKEQQQQQNNNNNNNSYDNIINDVIAIINKGDIISAENKV